MAEQMRGGLGSPDLTLCKMESKGLIDESSCFVMKTVEEFIKFVRVHRVGNHGMFLHVNQATSLRPRAILCRAQHLVNSDTQVETQQG